MLFMKDENKRIFRTKYQKKEQEFLDSIKKYLEERGGIMKTFEKTSKEFLNQVSREALVKYNKKKNINDTTKKTFESTDNNEDLTSCKDADDMFEELDINNPLKNLHEYQNRS